MRTSRTLLVGLATACSSRCRELAVLVLVLGGLAAGCTRNIELVGYGDRPGIQHGVKAELLNKAPDGAIIVVQNVSSNILSLNQCPYAMDVSVKKRVGEALKDVKPWAHIEHGRMKTSPEPDDFVILAPSQTRRIPVPVSYKEDRYSTPTAIYRIEKGSLYEVIVRLDPYFGNFTRETASKTLQEFQIPNYLGEPLVLNSMTIRAR